MAGSTGRNASENPAGIETVRQRNGSDFYLHGVATHQKTQQGLKHELAKKYGCSQSVVATHQKTQQGLKLR